MIFAAADGGDHDSYAAEFRTIEPDRGPRPSRRGHCESRRCSRRRPSFSCATVRSVPTALRGCRPRRRCRPPVQMCRPGGAADAARRRCDPAPPYRKIAPFPLAPAADRHAAATAHGRADDATRDTQHGPAGPQCAQRAAIAGFGCAARTGPPRGFARPPERLGWRPPEPFLGPLFEPPSQPPHHSAPADLQRRMMAPFGSSRPRARTNVDGSHLYSANRDIIKLEGLEAEAQEACQPTDYIVVGARFRGGGCRRPASLTLVNKCCCSEAVGPAHPGRVIPRNGPADYQSPPAIGSIPPSLRRHQRDGSRSARANARGSSSINGWCLSAASPDLRTWAQMGNRVGSYLQVSAFL